MIAQWVMDPDLATALLGGLSPTAFMRRHWQKRPLLVRAALPDALPALDPRRLFALAAQEGVESRLVVRDEHDRWSLRPGPLPRRALPSLATPGWTLLVQGVDLHDDDAHRLLSRFRFVADARLDDLMVSYASDGGGVGPHADSYDVFLLQLAGQRRWRVGPVSKPRLRDDVPLKMLAAFTPRHDGLLGPGDMLYLPPGWGHDGVAEGPCLTASIGFRAPATTELGVDLLERIVDAQRDDAADDDGAPTRAIAPRYRDRSEAATAHPARVPEGLQRFGVAAVSRLLADRQAQARALGESLSEPKPGVRFDASAAAATEAGVVLDRRTRMLYDDGHVYVNGESYRAGGRDAALMRVLADERRLSSKGVARLSAEAASLLLRWATDGWCHGADPAPK